MSCENHKKEVAGISDMKVLAEMIGDLHYEALTELLNNLKLKLYQDFDRDLRGNKFKLSYALHRAAIKIGEAATDIEKAWQISKKFMEPKT